MAGDCGKEKLPGNWCILMFFVLFFKQKQRLSQAHLPALIPSVILSYFMEFSSPLITLLYLPGTKGHIKCKVFGVPVSCNIQSMRVNICLI